MQYNKIFTWSQLATILAWCGAFDQCGYGLLFSDVRRHWIDKKYVTLCTSVLTESTTSSL